MNSHEFALYAPDLSAQFTHVVITDLDMIRRIARVLRLDTDDHLILFDQDQYVRVRIQALSKKEIVCELISKHTNKKHKPALSLLLPILKRDAFEAALYLLVEAGVQDIYPVVTTKVHRAWGGQRERDRLERIIISAAEQCKNFNFPTLHDPIQLVEGLAYEAEKKLFFDAEGLPFSQVNQSLVDVESLLLLIGPEADLTPAEKNLADQHGFMRSKLTSTILRAQDAAGLAACMIRSLHS